MPYDENSGRSRQNAAVCLSQSSVNRANRRFHIGISTEALLCLMLTILEAPGKMPLSASHRAPLMMNIQEAPGKMPLSAFPKKTAVLRGRSTHVDHN